MIVPCSYSGVFSLWLGSGKNNEFVWLESHNPVIIMTYALVVTDMTHCTCGGVDDRRRYVVNDICKNIIRYVPLSNSFVTGPCERGRYRRSSEEDGGRMTMNGNVPITNKDIVSYYSLMLKSFRYHVNIEYCDSNRDAVYMNKLWIYGNDTIFFQFADPVFHEFWDETRNFVQRRNLDDYYTF